MLNTNHSVDTHTPELNASVGMLLLKLKGTYNPTNKTEIFDNYISELEKKIQALAKTDQELGAAWKYIQTKPQEVPDHWDKVSFWKQNDDGTGGIITLTITLKETLALVYAALTDKEVFWNDAKQKAFPGGSDTKEIIAFREKFEADYETDDANRLLTLCNGFKTLHQKNVCHAGIRNDIVMTLNGVIPGVWIIEDLSDFILNLFREHLKKQIDAIEAAEEPAVKEHYHEGV